MGEEIIDEQDVNRLRRHLPEADERLRPIDTRDAPDSFKQHLPEMSGVSQAESDEQVLRPGYLVDILDLWSAP